MAFLSLVLIGVRVFALSLSRLTMTDFSCQYSRWFRFSVPRSVFGRAHHSQCGELLGHIHTILDTCAFQGSSCLETPRPRPCHDQSSQPIRADLPESSSGRVCQILQSASDPLHFRRSLRTLVLCKLDRDDCSVVCFRLESRSSCARVRLEIRTHCMEHEQRLWIQRDPDGTI